MVNLTARLGLSAVGISVFALATPVHAHIRMEGLEARTKEQKVAPCGLADTEWGATKVYEFEPGETIEVTINEYIPHPGYFRIAFDKDGDDGFEDPETIQPVDPNRTKVNERDKDTGSDFCKNDAVLMDNLDAHITASQSTYTYEVKLPDVECERCTLQVIQVMEDVIHGPYNLVVEGFPFDMEDLYHQCVDMTLKRKSGGAAPSGEWPKCSIGPMVDNQVNDPNKDKYKDMPVVMQDAGSQPSSRDAGVSDPDGEPTGDHGDHGDEGSKGDEDPAPAKRDAGTASTTKRDASSASDDDDEKPSASSSEGCALASGGVGDLSWLLLSLGLFAARRRRVV